MRPFIHFLFVFLVVFALACSDDDLPEDAASSAATSSSAGVSSSVAASSSVAVSSSTAASSSAPVSSSATASSAASSLAGSVLLEQPFTEGGASSAPAGWTFVNVGLPYTSDASSGLAPNSVKFDNTGVQVVSAPFVGGYGLQFWIKGLGTSSASYLSVEVLQNGSWVPVATIGGSADNLIPTTEATKTYALPPGSTQVRFTYTKGAGNVALDDVVIYNYTPSGASSSAASSSVAASSSAVSSSVASSSSSSATSVSGDKMPNTELGIPTDSTPDDEYIITRSQYVLSYSKDKAVANWVSWNLNSSWIGTLPRDDSFKADPLIPAGYPVVGENEYSGSGYDRGHLCPNADRDASEDDMAATFYMSNMVPQLHSLNAGPWLGLENYGRTLAGGNKELYIIAGCIFGTTWDTVNNAGKVAISTHSWKIVVVLERGQGLANVTASTRVIAVKMPQAGGSPWTQWRVSVDQLEIETGYDFLSAVPADIQAVIEAQVDAVAL